MLNCLEFFKFPRGTISPTYSFTFSVILLWMELFVIFSSLQTFSCCI